MWHDNPGLTVALAPVSLRPIAEGIGDLLDNSAQGEIRDSTIGLARISLNSWCRFPGGASLTHGSNRDSENIVKSVGPIIRRYHC